MLSGGLSPGLGAQCHGRSRGSRADRRAAHLGRPRCRRSRGCASSSMPCWRSGAVDEAREGARSPSRCTRRRRVGRHRGAAHRGQPAALRPQPRRRRGDRAQIRPDAQAYRVRPPRCRARHGGAGGRGRHGGKPRPAAAAGPDRQHADAGRRTIWRIWRSDERWPKRARRSSSSARKRCTNSTN